MEAGGVITYPNSEGILSQGISYLTKEDIIRTYAKVKAAVHLSLLSQFLCSS